jgi:sulfite reductase alpha subunit-like flavoprotein
MVVVVWCAGDALGLMPTNNPPEVAALMKVLALGDGSRRVASPLKKRANDPDYDPMPTVHSLLMSYYDLKKVRAELVAALVPYVKDAEQKKRITALLQGGVSHTHTHTASLCTHRKP